jgi:hypothetical protein
MNTITEMFDYIRSNVMEFITACLCCAGGTLLVYLSFAAYWGITQVAVYSQEIPPNMICIKDAVPNGYICSPDATIPWYLSSEGDLTNAKG